MLAYFRMTETGYDEYNLANAANDKVPAFVSFNDIVYL
jgi:hypothetical protein